MYFTNIHEFKGAARSIQRDLKKLSLRRPVVTSDLLPTLITLDALPSKEDVLSLSDSLVEQFNKYPIAQYQLSFILQTLARASFGHCYEAVKSLLPDKPMGFFELFPEASSMIPELKKHGRVHHPFPREFSQYPFLKEWQLMWEEDNFSEVGHPFFPPMIPCESFGKKVARVEKVKSWSTVDEKKASTIQNAQALILMYDEYDVVIAYAKWHYWSQHYLSGMDFSFRLNSKEKAFQVSFDLRPSAELPTYGPHINFDVEKFTYGDSNWRERIELLIEEVSWRGKEE